MRLDQSNTHSKLVSHAAEMHVTHMRDLFAQEPGRFEKLSLQAPHIFLDYSKNRVTDTTLQLLIESAREAGLPEQIKALVSGEELNNTEKRPALHTALRKPKGESLFLNGVDILKEVHETQDRMAAFVQKIHEGEYLGYSGKPINTLVSIGIGGSFLGPKTVTDSLKPYAIEGLSVHYVANIDGTDLTEHLKLVDPETTLFLIQSKSFTTLETIENGDAAKAWLRKQGLSETDLSKHFIAVSANVPAATAYGIAEEHIFPMWDWVGGRYSLWSAIGLPIAFLLGMEAFRELLAGAHAMDQHFEHSPFEANAPVLMALLGIWYGNFFSADSHAVLPYDEYLHYLPEHLQQLDMESNGKHVDRDGNTLHYHTGPIIWGGPGSNGQHAYHQLLHQGTRFISADFIIPLYPHHDLATHHEFLYANCLSQTQALMQGKTEEEAYAELIASGKSEDEARRLAPHKEIAGNKPSNTLILEKTTPASIGALIALYEHKVFVQGVMWGVNSFDQWGVELGKQLGGQIFNCLKGGDVPKQFDDSTLGLIQKFKDKV